MPSTRLVAITELVDKVVGSSEGNLPIEEVVYALDRAYDGDSMMIYDGSWKGLKPAIDGDRYEEHSGYNTRVDLISDLFNSKYWTPRGADYTFRGTDGRIDAGEIMLAKEDGERLFAAMMDIFYPEASSSNGTVEAISKEKTVPAISGATFDRLQRAIEAFPTRYPEYSTKPPKLDDDVRPWLKESGLGENDAERRVFGAIIREHFKLSPDTLKSQ